MSERCSMPGNQRRAPPPTADVLQACRMPIGAILAPADLCTHCSKAFRYSSNAIQCGKKRRADKVAKPWFFRRQSEHSACRGIILSRLAHDARTEKDNGFSISRVCQNLRFSAARTLCGERLAGL